MKISTKHTTDTEVSMAVIASGAELNLIKDGVLAEIAKTIKVTGFRAGKAPLKMVEKEVEPALLQQQFLDEAINQLYVQAAQTEKLRPLATPEITISKFVPFTTLEFTAKIPVVGVVKLADYKKMKKLRPVVKITTKDVEGVIESLRLKSAKKNDVDRVAKDSDQVWIDFKGVDSKGKAVKSAEGKDYPLALGSNTFIPGFEANVIGMKSGQEKTFTLKFPKSYAVKSLANKDVVFTVTLTKVQEVILAKIDDDFAKQVGPFKTVNELKNDIKKQLAFERQKQSDLDYESVVVRDIAAKSKVNVPEVLLEQSAERIETELKQNLVYRGQTWQEFLQSQDKTEQEYREQVVNKQAQDRVKASIVLSEIAEKEALDITAKELETRMHELEAQHGQDAKMLEELKKPEARRDIASRMLTQKAVAKIVSYVNKK